MNPASIKTQKGQSPQSEFRELLDQYAGAVQEAGVAISPYDRRELPLFTLLTPELQARAILDVRCAVDVIQGMKNEGHSLKDSSKYLWRTLKHLGFIPCSDIFNRITDGDVVIIYSTEHKQVFQNLHFFELVNLTIEELYCSEWYKYTQRPEWAQKALFEAGNAVFSGQAQGTFDPGVEEHLAEEVNPDGGPTARLRVKVKWMSPVKKDDQIAGVIVVNTSIPVEL